MVKPVSIAINSRDEIAVLCDDGTVYVWYADRHEWEPTEPIPAMMPPP